MGSTRVARRCWQERCQERNYADGGGCQPHTRRIRGIQFVQDAVEYARDDKSGNDPDAQTGGDHFQPFSQNQGLDVAASGPERKANPDLLRAL